MYGKSLRGNRERGGKGGVDLRGRREGKSNLSGEAEEEWLPILESKIIFIQIREGSGEERVKEGQGEGGTGG